MIIKLSKLVENRGQIEGLPANPRFIKDDKYAKLKKSIEDDPEMLELRELLVYPLGNKFVVIGGNMRLKALRELGATECPCKVIPAETPVEKLRAYTIKDNNTFGDYDWSKLNSEWDTAELEDWGCDLPDIEDVVQDEKELLKEDDYSEEEAEQAEPRVARGEIWQLGNHRLMCGDSTCEKDVVTLVEGKGIDLFLTDPPYNVDVTGGTKDHLKIMNDNMSDDDFDEFLVGAFSTAIKCIKNGGCFYVWYASRTHIAFEKALRRVGFLVKQQLIWVKNTFVLGRQDYQWKHELCLYGWKDGGSHYFIDSRAESTIIEDAGLDFKKMKKEEMQKLLQQIYSDKMSTSVIHEDKPTKNDLHPTMKPVALMGRLIANSTRKGERVLDLFGGSGSTLIACEQLKRKCYMMELDPHYCDVIIDRWEKATGQQATKL